jgi:lipopolysaccharide/colanic/teichoic acid biosynthesis glycosyltransferase
MAGVVLSFFLMVSEILLMRKRVVAILTRLKNYYRSGKFIRLFLSTLAILALILVQPLIVGLLVVIALDKVDPHFSTSVIREIRQGLSGIIG